MDNEQMVSFTMGGMAFEYDEQKIGSIFKNTVSRSKAPPVYSLITTVLNFLMMNTATTKTAMTPSETPPPEWSATKSGTL